MPEHTPDQLQITIELDNAALSGADRDWEIKRILHRAAFNIERDGTDARHKLTDRNGNTVARIEWINDDFKSEG